MRFLPCKRLTEPEIQAAIEKGEAYPVYLPGGRLVVQRFGQVLHVLRLDFERLDYPGMMRVLVALAKQYHCRFIEGGGRKGWQRKLKPLGFVPIDDGLMQYEVKKWEA